MEVILLKDSHVGKKGEVKSFPYARAEYLIRVGIAGKLEDKKAVVKDDNPKKPSGRPKKTAKK